jgi:hypothetical protein
LLFARSQNHTSVQVCSLIEHHLNRWKISDKKEEVLAPVTVAARDQPSGGNGSRTAKRSARCVA